MSNNTTGPVDKEIQEIYALFFDVNPITADIIDTIKSNSLQTSHVPWSYTKGTFYFIHGYKEFLLLCR